MVNKTMQAIKRRLGNLQDDPPENSAQYKAAFKQAVDDIDALLLYAETHEFILSQIAQARTVKIEIKESAVDLSLPAIIDVQVWDYIGNPITHGQSVNRLEQAIADAKEGLN